MSYVIDENNENVVLTWDRCPLDVLSTRQWGIERWFLRKKTTRFSGVLHHAVTSKPQNQAIEHLTSRYIKPQVHWEICLPVVCAGFCLVTSCNIPSSPTSKCHKWHKVIQNDTKWHWILLTSTYSQFNFVDEKSERYKQARISESVGIVGQWAWIRGIMLVSAILSNLPEVEVAAAFLQMTRCQPQFGKDNSGKDNSQHETAVDSLETQTLPASSSQAATKPRQHGNTHYWHYCIKSSAKLAMFSKIQHGRTVSKYLFDLQLPSNMQQVLINFGTAIVDQIPNFLRHVTSSPSIW